MKIGLSRGVCLRVSGAILFLRLSSFVPVQQDAQPFPSIKVTYHVFTDTVLSSCKLLVVTDFATKLSPEVGFVVFVDVYTSI